MQDSCKRNVVCRVIRFKCDSKHHDVSDSTNKDVHHAKGVDVDQLQKVAKGLRCINVQTRHKTLQ